MEVFGQTGLITLRPGTGLIAMLGAGIRVRKRTAVRNLGRADIAGGCALGMTGMGASIPSTSGSGITAIDGS